MGSGRSLERFFKKVGRGSQARGIGAFGFGASSLPRGKNSLRLPCSAQKIPCSPAQGILSKLLNCKRFSAPIS